MLSETIDKHVGTFGTGDLLIKLGVEYGSDESIKIIDHLFKFIATTAVETSLQLAKVEGCYPMCNKEALVNSSFIQALDLPIATLNDIKKYGLFNSQLLTCPPTGSTATMLQVSTGVEPNFAFSFNRRTVSLNKEETVYKVEADIVNQYRKVTGNKEDLPSYFIAAHQIDPYKRIKVQATLQKWIDASISSTINLDESTTIEDVYNIYIEAWKQGLKGITIWRNNCQRQSILSTETKKEVSNTYCEPQLDSINTISRDDLGQVLSGSTYKYKTACGALYITVNKDSDGNIVEVFTNSSKNGTCKANLNGETRLISLALRAGVKTEEVIDTLKSIQCQSCVFAKAKGNKIDGTSCPDMIAKCLKDSYKPDHSTQESVLKAVKLIQESNRITGLSKCPNCNENTLIHSAGCVSCTSCGYSKCN